MEMIKEVLHAYAIYPLNIEKVMERLYRVRDGQREYALKVSSLSKEKLTDWESAYQQAFSQNLSSVLPVYLTKEGNLYLEMNQSIFYLTPWLNTAEMQYNKQTIEQFYRSIGRIHAKTKREKSISAADFIHRFNTYKKFCQETAISLLGFVEQFEKTRFMSPFELLVCTQYRDLEYALNEINKRIEQLLNEEEEHITWNYSLCHGNLNFSHILNTNQTYIINLEKAYYDNAVMDLFAFFRNESTYYDQSNDLLISLFSVYNEENNLTNNELFLLTIHLLDPVSYISIVQNYVNNRSQDTMVNHVVKLQHAFRQLLFGLKWSSYVENEYETISFDDLES